MLVSRFFLAVFEGIIVCLFLGLLGTSKSCGWSGGGL